MADSYTGAHEPTPPVVPWVGVAQAAPTIPKLYWDAYSDEQRIKALWKCFDQLIELYNQMVPQVNENTQDNTELQKTLQDLLDGRGVDAYIDMLRQWIDDNIQAIVTRWAYFAFPGLEQFPDGTWHFTMTVPQSWAFLKFQFPFAPDDGENGTYHLMLVY